MPSIIVSYEDNSTATLNNTTTISMQAVPNGSYKHNDKDVKQLDIDLDSSASATLSITSTGASMPAQTCFSQYGTSQTGPFKCEWRMTSATVASMTLTIPAGTSSSYFTRMAIDAGADMDINISR
jgi:hypothetical protein